jgi:signal transduction histidine kinase/CheY-like chemotaxis protein
MTTPDQESARVLILAPVGRDGPASAELLRRVGLEAAVCSSLDHMVGHLQVAGAVFIAEEALFGKDLSAVTTWVEDQPAWSDMPFIVLTGGQRQASVIAWRQRLVSRLRNVTLLERPMQAITLTSTVRAAVRARLRQYEVRLLLEARERTAQELEALVVARTQELEKTNEVLRQEIAERARVEAALRQAQKMEAVGQLSGGIAHDFNNLLQGMAGCLDLIRLKSSDSERVRRWAEAGLQAAERGRKLTGQLLAFSRTQRIEAKPVIVSALVSGIQDLLVRTLGPMIRITFALDSDGVPVLSDPTQLEMAVLNLAINARDAMPEGGNLAIATRVQRITNDPELEPDSYVELSVSDTGTGMSAEVAARAFDPFYTTKGIGKGTGLGLSQVYGISRQAGGTARIESELGQGTTIRLLLRRTDISTEMDAPSATAEREMTAPSATVLVIDDDAHVRRFLTDSLDALGYRVAEAEDGHTGLRALETIMPDVLVIDFAMPGLNGAEVAAAAWARLPGLPIVFASGYADTAAIEDVAGPNTPILRKPFGVNELKVAIADALRKP